MKNSVLVVADQALLPFHMTNVYRSKVFLKSVCAGRGQVLIALAKLSVIVCLAVSSRLNINNTVLRFWCLCSKQNWTLSSSKGSPAPQFMFSGVVRKKEI